MVSDSSESPCSPAKLEDQLEGLRKAVQQWSSNGGSTSEENIYSFALKRFIPDKQLKLSSLEGEDEVRVKLVADAFAQSKDFLILLANVERQVQSSESDARQPDRNQFKVRRAIDLHDIRMPHILGSILEKDLETGDGGSVASLSKATVSYPGTWCQYLRR